MPRASRTIEALSLLTIPDEVIGLWRFREVGTPRRWAATFCVDGIYYDTVGHLTLRTCLAAVDRRLRALKRDEVDT